MSNLSPSNAFFQALNIYTKTDFRPGLCPRTPLGELTTLPRLHSRMGRGTSSSPSTPSACRSQRLDS